MFVNRELVQPEMQGNYFISVSGGENYYVCVSGPRIFLHLKYYVNNKIDFFTFAWRFLTINGFLHLANISQVVTFFFRGLKFHIKQSFLSIQLFCNFTTVVYHISETRILKINSVAFALETLVLSNTDIAAGMQLSGRAFALHVKGPGFDPRHLHFFFRCNSSHHSFPTSLFTNKDVIFVRWTFWK